MTNKEKIIKHLQDSKMILNDAFTFSWLRIARQDLVDKNKLGGGNFLMALGAFASLNFAAKILWMIQNGQEASLTRKQRDIIEAKIKELPSRLRSKVQIKSGINELEAFIRLVDWYDGRSPSNRLSLARYNREQLEDVWKGIRNALSHMSFPSSGFQMLTYGGDPKPVSEISPVDLRKNMRKSPQIVLALALSDEYPFVKFCQSDTLIVGTEELIDALIKHIEDLDEDNPNIDACANWIDKWRMQN